MAYLMPCDPLQMRSMYQREDSEDSDGEGGLGNVNRVLIRPPEHTGKAKKGHLCFDASFECGNLGRVDLISEYEYDLFIRPDTCSPRYRIWFNFTVDNYKQDQRVIFNIVNFSKNKLLFRNGILTPLVKSTLRPYWQRIPKQYVWYHQSKFHSYKYILTFAFAFDKEEEHIYQFALSQPYSYSRLQLYLNLLLNHKNKNNNQLIINKELLSTSIQHRNVDIITIGKIINNNNNNNITTTKQHVCVILARIHGGEPPTSFICQGLLEYLTSTQDLFIQLLRKQNNIIFKIIPMLNPDGVYLGNYKSTSMGFDLNHLYHLASPYAHPTIYSLIQMLKGLDDSKSIELDFIIDLHAHMNLFGTFIYGSTYDDIYRYERHIVFPKLLLQHSSDDYNLLNTMYNSSSASDFNKIGTARRYLCSILSDTVNCYTLHVSMGGYYSNHNHHNIIPYTKDSYMRLGRNLIRTFIEYYKMIGILITNDLGYELLFNNNNNNMVEHLSRSRYKKERNKNKQQHNKSSLSPPYNINKIRSRSLSYLNTQRKSAIQHYTNIINNYNNNNNNNTCCNELITSTNCITKEKYGGAALKARIRSTKQQNTNTNLLFNYGASSTMATLPSLSIIDFNQLTRFGIDQAIAAAAAAAATSNQSTNTTTTTHYNTKLNKYNNINNYCSKKR